MDIHIERVRPDDWARLREIRLRSLRDSPDAFATLLADDEGQPASFWQDRIGRPDRATFVAREQVADLGLASGARFLGRTGVAGLFGMWVAPEARRRGIAELLIRAVIGWARDAGFRQLVLEVADSNASAIRLYARCGFEPTGRTGTMPAPRSHITEHERALRL